LFKKECNQPRNRYIADKNDQRPRAKNLFGTGKSPTLNPKGEGKGKTVPLGSGTPAGQSKCSEMAWVRKNVKFKKDCA